MSNLATKEDEEWIVSRLKEDRRKDWLREKDGLRNSEQASGGF